MATITVELSDSQLQRLRTLAATHGLAPEALLEANLEDWLNGADREFEAVAENVLAKNAELYRRLA